MSKNIMGIDPSTSITGICIMNEEDLSIIYLGHCDTKKIKGLSNKAIMLEKHLIELAETYKVNDIAIEEPLLMFAGGKSSASVISTLSQINGMCQLLVKQIWDIEPTMLNCSSARKIAFPNMKFTRGIKRKITVQQKVVREYPDIDVPLKRTGTIKDHVYDMCDALVVALAQCKK